MILGISKIWKKTGPVDLLIITKCLKKYKKLWNHPGKNTIYVNTGLKKSQKKIGNACPRYHMFSICSFFLGGKFEYIFSKYFRGDEEREIINVPYKNICKRLDMNFISIKNMKRIFGNFSIFW